MIHTSLPHEDEAIDTILYACRILGWTVVRSVHGSRDQLEGMLIGEHNFVESQLEIKVPLAPSEFH